MMQQIVVALVRGGPDSTSSTRALTLIMDHVYTEGKLYPRDLPKEV
jgi:hypothetical protein